MPQIVRGPYIIDYDASHMRLLIARVGLDAPYMQQLSNVVRKVGLIIQTRAVYNVTGHPFVATTGRGVIRVRTGALRGSIEMQHPYQNALMCRVYVNGAMTSTGEKWGGFSSRPRPVRQYAWAIELGHRPIDLKKTRLAGKTVPFFGARSTTATGPYAAIGLKPVDPTKPESVGAKFQSNALNAKLAAKGKRPMYFTKKGGNPKKKHYGGNSSYYIAFRRVGKTGWIVPEAKPRPFMRAAGENTTEQARLMFRRGILAIMRGQNPEGGGQPA